MFHIVLYQPEIPPNTGNIIRLCANTGAALHLIKPLGFALDDKRLRRAGLDYHEWADVQQYDDLDAFMREIKPGTVWPCSTRGRTYYHQARFHPGDAILFGPETRGLPPAVLDQFPVGQCLRLPMKVQSRSLNLSNAVAVFAYEAWRQQNFDGASV